MEPSSSGLESLFTWNDCSVVRGVVPHGPNQGRPFTIAQPLAERYQVLGFFASGGMGLLLEGRDRRTQARVLIKCNLMYDVVPYARVRDIEGFSRQLRLPRKTLEMERRILVLLRNAGCNAVPHPHDFVYDVNPLLAGPYATEDGGEWTYDETALLEAEPYLIMEHVPGRTLQDVLAAAPEHRLPAERCVHIFLQVAEVLEVLHQPRPMRAGMTWQLIYQDLKPANIILSDLDRVTVVDLGGSQLINLEAQQKLLPGASTAGYCPPEIEMPYGVLTPAADVYTVGTNLFHALTGRNPAEFLPPQLASQGPRAVRLDLAQLEGKCSAALKGVIERCLDPDPARRYPDAAALVTELRGLTETVG